MLSRRDIVGGSDVKNMNGIIVEHTLVNFGLIEFCTSEVIATASMKSSDEFVGNIVKWTAKRRAVSKPNTTTV